MAGARPQENYKPPKGRKKKKQEEVVAVALDDLPSDFDFSLLAENCEDLVAGKQRKDKRRPLLVYSLA